MAGGAVVRDRAADRHGGGRRGVRKGSGRQHRPDGCNHPDAGDDRAQQPSHLALSSCGFAANNTNTRACEEICVRLRRAAHARRWWLHASRRACVSPLRPRARCISAPPWWRLPTPSRRRRWAVSCCCASTTPTRSGRRRARSRGSSTISPGSAWSLPGLPIRQSDRRGLHVAAAGELLATAHAYRCFCPPSQERYEGRCRALPRADAELRHEAGEPNVIRFRVPSADVVVDDATRGPVRFAADEISDFVLVRADGRPTFDLATAVDDRDLAITHIVRGEDHLANSARHLLLLRALGTIEPSCSPTARSSSAPTASGCRRAEGQSRSPPCAERRPARSRGRVCRSARLPRAGRRQRGGVAARARTALLARPPGARHCACRPAHLAWLGREVLAGLPSAELARRLAPFLPDGTPDEVVLEALAEAARGASALGESRRLCCASGTEPGRSAAGVAGARAVLRPACRGRARAHALRGGGGADRQPARARPGARHLAPGRATPPANGSHGPVARPAPAGRGHGACRARRLSRGAGGRHDTTNTKAL